MDKPTNIQVYRNRRILTLLANELIRDMAKTMPVKPFLLEIEKEVEVAAQATLNR